MNEKWYAVYTKPRWEKKVAEILTTRKITNYCPLNRLVKQWSDRKKVVYEPLFTSYVFVHISDKHLGELRKIDGVINLVYWLGKPAVIKDSEIEVIKEFLEEHKHVRLEKVYMSVNDHVKVIRGPLMEKVGSVVAIKNNMVKVALPSLGYVMYADLSVSNVVKVANSHQANAQGVINQKLVR